VPVAAVVSGDYCCFWRWSFCVICGVSTQGEQLVHSFPVGDSHGGMQLLHDGGMGRVSNASATLCFVTLFLPAIYCET
jgi:hypothetical protein